MDHPFIVRLHYAFQTSSKLYLLVDLMPGVILLKFRANFFICLDVTKSFQKVSPNFMPLKYCWPWSIFISARSFIET